MTNSELDDVVKRYMNGEKEAFDEIYYATQKTVYLSIRTIFSESQIIEDLMQDTYMKMINSLEGYKIGTNFTAWVSQIAHNIAINHYNKKKRIDICDPTDVIFSKEDPSSKLNYYLSFLKGTERDVVIYHLILNLKFKEIAKILGIPLSTTFAIYKQAISRIKKGL